MQISPQLSPGQCALVTVNLNPSLTSGTLGYYVPVTGGISAWYKDSVSVPTMMSMGRHYDWNLYVEDLEQYVHVSLQTAMLTS
ncbi:g2089 [Coccomyxa elongata]